jgi:hypothetical protein
MFGGPPMAYVFAKVKRSNSASKRLMDEHGFDDQGNPEGEHVLLRPPELDPTFTRAQTGPVRVSYSRDVTTPAHRAAPILRAP